MKKASLLFILFLSASFAMAQPRPGIVEYDKQQVPCYIADFPYTPSITENAIKERFKSMNVKTSDHKGFIEVSNVVLPELGSSAVDVKFKIEKQGKDKNASTVYMIVNPAGQGTVQPVARTVNGLDITTGATNFLNSMNTTTADYSLEMEIKKQEEELNKAEKRSTNLVEDGADMQKRLQKLQNDIAENQRKQAEQVIEVQKQRDLLIQVQARRRMKS